MITPKPGTVATYEAGKLDLIKMVRDVIRQNPNANNMSLLDIKSAVEDHLAEQVITYDMRSVIETLAGLIVNERLTVAQVHRALDRAIAGRKAQLDANQAS